MSTVVITGTSSGIGRALARRFAREGWFVVASARDVSRVHLELPPGESTQVLALPLDLLDAASVEWFAAEVEKRGIGVDVLINNAGVCTLGALETVADSELRLSFETNVFGPLALTRKLLPGMRSTGSGRVVFIGAIGALLNTPYLGAYCTTKHALDCVAATLDVELQPFGIRSLSVHPGATTTEIGGKLLGDAGRGTVYEDPAARYADGLRARIAGSTDTADRVADEVLRICMLPDPRQRYVLSSTLGPVLEPLVEEMEMLHVRERESARLLQVPKAPADAPLTVSTGEGPG